MSRSFPHPTWSKICISGLLFLAATLPAAFSADTCTADPKYSFPQKSWAHADAAAAGWSLEELQAAKDYAKAIGSQSWLLIENGKIVDSYGPLDTLNSLHSARKSFMSAMYGQAIADGTIDISKTLADLGIDDNDPKLTPEEKQATIRDLLMARSGVYHVALGEAPSMAAARPQRHSHPHGTFWYYNNWDFNALGTIFNQLTKKSLFEFMQDRIAVPLQMEDFKLSAQEYDEGPESIHKYYNMELSARDMARFGQLFLSDGCWDGHQIVPAAWVKESTAPYSDTVSNFLPAGNGYYGYLWWVVAHNKSFPNTSLPEGSFAALGVGPQIILVVPKKGLVLVHRTATDSACPADNKDCDVPLLSNAKVFTLMEMLVMAKK
jgi:CubicO group peptidase (beta-lactamase class C family)